MRRTIAFCAALIFIGTLSLSLTGCKGASLPTWSQIEQTVLTDLENGTILSDIEVAVGALDPAIAGDIAAVDNIIQQAITFLQSTGAIPPATQPAALAMQQHITAKIALPING